MDSRDWRDAARGIPVWIGAFVQALTFGGDYRPGFIGHAGIRMSDTGHVLPLTGREVPDLSDPDTRVAYDRRLALALGAPVEAVEEGVSIYRDEDSWSLRAGAPRNYPSDADVEPWYYTLGIRDDHVNAGRPTADPLLVRALAWPADKRVSALEAAPR